ncbi:hypothetical protein H4696_009783 [Amycolatopsis lexingtonensis]|uniref:Uncharacterized protein n=1 Tax=Amycolatopsis lexingtonensis TaxID=218822 RepID=A0ABR9IHP1_9PSEU|nr:hypothetical protein [Amycolatopsis lexingtonensis]MBE1502683.1 hypothetical protein [Amycolatopsis lexingtonensis]
MSTAHDNLTAIAALLDHAGLGPVEVYATPATGIPDGVVTAELPPGPDVARRLLRWLEFLDVIDAIAGKYHERDTVLRLTVRGLTPSGAPIFVVGGFDETTDPAAVALILDQIERQDIARLLASLAERERGIAS